MTTTPCFGRHEFRAIGTSKLAWNIQARRILRRTTFHASPPSVWRISQKFDQVGAVVIYRSEGGLHARNGLCEFPARACGCVWLVGEASLGSARHEGLSASLPLALPPPLFVRVLCTWPGGQIGVRPHGRVDLREI